MLKKKMLGVLLDFTVLPKKGSLFLFFKPSKHRYSRPMFKAFKIEYLKAR